MPRFRTEGDVGEGRRPRQPVAVEPPLTALVRARDRVERVFASIVWHCAHGALVGMWFAGLALPVWSVAKVGVVVWQPVQSPLVGWFLSNAVGRESPAAVEVLAIMPT